MLRDVEKNEELVVFYDSLHKPNHNRRSEESRQGDRVGRPMVVQGLARGESTNTSDLIAPEIAVQGRVRWWADDDSEDDAPLEFSDKLSHGGKSLCTSGRPTFTKEIIDLTMDSDEDGKIIQLRPQEDTAARD